MKFHRSVTLSKTAIEFISLQDGASFSDSLEKLIQKHRHENADYKRADNVAMLRAAAQVLKRDCNCPDGAIASWAREAVREVKK